MIKQSILDGAEPMYIPPEDPEIKKISAMTTQSQKRFSFPDRLRYFSSWHKAKRAVAVCLRLQKRYRSFPSLKVSEEDRYVPVNAGTPRGRDSDCQERSRKRVP